MVSLLHRLQQIVADPSSSKKQRLWQHKAERTKWLRLERFYETYELLENILLCLPVRDILFAQRISTMSRSLIAQSHKIGSALFRTPYSKIPGFGLSPWNACGRWKREDSKLHTPVFNPLMKRFLADRIDCSIVHEGFVSPQDTSQQITSPRPNIALMYPQASWRPLFMTQPPLREITLDTFEYDDYHCEGPDIGSEEGLTMDCVWKGLVEHWYVCPDHPSRGYWSFFGDDDVTQLNNDVTGWEVFAKLYEAEAEWRARGDKTKEGDGGKGEQGSE